MKKTFIILLFCICVKAKGQQLTVDSLANIIRTIQKDIVDLKKPDTLTHTASQFTVTTINPKHKSVSINNYAVMNSSGLAAAKASADVITLTTQLNAANAKIATLDVALKALQAKVAALKAVSTTTTTIQ